MAYRAILVLLLLLAVKIDLSYSEDVAVKVLVVGAVNVGKSNLIRRYTDEGYTFSDKYVPTVGIDFMRKTITRGDLNVALQLWDTSGNPRFRSITKAYYRGTKGFVIVFDVTDQASFDAVQSFYDEVKGENIKVILIGNKSDMKDKRVITTEQGQTLADQIGVPFFETSVKENINIEPAFEKLLDMILEEMGPAPTTSAPTPEATNEETTDEAIDGNEFAFDIDKHKPEGEESNSNLVYLWALLPIALVVICIIGCIVLTTRARKRREAANRTTDPLMKR